MFRNLVRVIALFAALYSTGALALGLGDVQLNSGLNEPLDAEIKLLNVGDLNASQIIIKLASPEDFARAGAERDFFLTNFKYETILDQRGGGVVKITTKELVREPYLNFLLEARWPAGKLVREYTLLVDLPVFKSTGDKPRVSQAPESSRSSAAANPSSSSSAPRREPVRSTQTLASANVTAAPAGMEGGETLTTKRHDTLWRLALQVRPTLEVGPQKVMMAMQELNPEAFIDNNINLLRTGAVLRVPTMQDIERIDSARARAEVAAQTKRWRSNSAPAPRQLEATPEDRSEPETALADAGADAGGSLRLTTGVTDDATTSGGTNEVAEGDNGSARADLLAAEKLLSGVRTENTELRSKVGALEAELAELKNRLQLRDDSLANLQNAAATPAMTAEKTSAQQKADSAATKTQPADALAETDPTTTPPPAPESKGLLATILDNPLYLGGLLALVAALLAGLFVAKRRSNEDDGFDVMAEVEAEDAYEESIEQPAIASYDDAGEADADATQSFSEFELDSLDNEEAVESEIGDPVAEADIYMAYGRFPQAVELLSRALEQEPERAELRVKLVEVHMAAGDSNAAQQQMALLEASGDTAAVQQAHALMGQEADLDGTIEQPEAIDEFNQLLADSEQMGTDELAPATPDFADDQPRDDGIHFDAAEDDNVGFAADIRAASSGAGASVDEGFDLELDLDLNDAVVGADENVELADLDIDMPASDSDMDIESELADLSSDLGMGDNEIGPASDATLADFEPDLDLNISDEEIAELEEGLVDSTKNDANAELDLIDAADETATKIDLARAYIDMGDTEGAKDILGEVLTEAENEQKLEAQELLDRIA